MIRKFLLANRVPYSSRLPITIQNVKSSIEGVTINRYVFINLYKNRILRYLKRKTPSKSISDLVVYLTLHQLSNTDEIINDAIDYIIREEEPVVIINRNPSLKIESLIAMKVNDVTKDMVLKVPPIVLQPMAGDIDGDILAVIPLFSKEAKEEALEFLGIRRIIRNKYSNQFISNDVHPYQDFLMGITLLEEKYKKEKGVTNE